MRKTLLIFQKLNNNLEINYNYNDNGIGTNLKKKMGYRMWKTVLYC